MTALPIYFDYMATTPVDRKVIDVMVRHLGIDGVFGNPASSSHLYGKLAAMAVERGREQVAALVNASSDEIIFTSGATEADNLAIIGASQFYQSKGRHVITMTTEHKAVLDSFKVLEQQGFEVTYLSPDKNGLLSLEKLKEALTPKTILVSIMQVNNEIGVIQDIAAIGRLLRDNGVIFHVDAAQSAGKIPIDLSVLPVDLMSFSAHKVYGPKGIGALYVRQKPRIRLQPQSFGGGHERGLRSGTLATHQIAGFGEAFAIAGQEMAEEQARILALRNQLWTGIQSIPGIQLNGHSTCRVAGNLNVSFAGVEGDSILFALRDLAISTTSACASASHQPSYVLRALGLSEEQAYSSIRLSLGRFTTIAEVASAIKIITTQIPRLREMASL